MKHETLAVRLALVAVAVALLVLFLGGCGDDPESIQVVDTTPTMDQWWDENGSAVDAVYDAYLDSWSAFQGNDYRAITLACDRLHQAAEVAWDRTVAHPMPSVDLDEDYRAAMVLFINGGEMCADAIAYGDFATLGVAFDKLAMGDDLLGQIATNLEIEEGTE